MEPGKHLILDFYGCNSELLNNYEQLKDLFEESLSLCNATVLKLTGNKFEPQGVTLLALLAESHASLHSWPEYNYCAMDGQIQLFLFFSSYSLGIFKLSLNKVYFMFKILKWGD